MQHAAALGPRTLAPLILAIGVVAALLGSNGLLTLASFALLAALVGLLWRPGEPPALLFAMAYHWAQASTLILYANTQSASVADMGSGPTAVLATWLTLAGVLVIAIGIRLGAGRCAMRPQLPGIMAMVHEFDIRKLFVTCLIALGLSLLTARLAGFVPGLTQPLLAVAIVRWAVVMLFAYVVFVRHEGYRLLLVLFLLELAIGFLGFFSDFKTVLVIVALAAAAAPQLLRGVRSGVLVLLVLVIVSLGVVWSGIKVEYRQFLNQGSGQQVVLVPVSERLGKLTTLVSELDGERLAESAEFLAQRVTYVHYFARSIDNVPASVPHQDGRLWGEALSRAFVPRLINPEKSIIDDSTRTTQFSGERVAGASEGTSISLGYIAESYIDFGRWGMFVALFAWGLAVGVAYRTLTRSGSYRLLAVICACTLVAVHVSVLEQSNLKMVAATLLGFLTLLVANRFGARKLLMLTLRPLRTPRVAHA